jgi:hypothetical protein
MSAAEMEIFRRRYGLDSGPAAPAPAAPVEAAPPPADPSAPPADGTAAVVSTGPLTPASNTNQVAVIGVTFRAISLSNVSPSANTDTAYAVLNELKACPLFDPEHTQFTGNIGADEPPGTFTFGVNIKLKRPLKL